MTDETAVLDPAEFIQGRTELDLRKDGLDIVEVDWGDAEMEKFYIKQALGEVPADERPPNRKVTMKLHARDDDAKYPTLAEVAYRLQSKIGTLSEKGGWVRRDMNSTQGFAVSVGAQVHNAVLGGIQGWFMSHRGIANEITLILTIGPYFYGTDEFSTAIVKQEAGRYVEYKKEAIKSTVKGLSRINIKNLGETPWRAIIWAEECDTAPDDLTDPRARLRYAPSELELVGEAAEYEAMEGGGKSVKMVEPGNTAFSTIVHSFVKTKGHMIHRGNRRLWARVWANAGGTTNYSVRTLWRPLGTTRWNEDNKTISVAPGLTKAKAVLIDLGELRATAPALGEERIEFLIQVEGNDTAAGGGNMLVLEDIYMLPLEQYIVLTDSEEASPPTNKASKNTGEAESAAELEVYNPENSNKLEKLSPGKIFTWQVPEYAGLYPGSPWVNPANIKVKDSSFSKAGMTGGGEPVEGGGGFCTAWLVAKKFGFAIPPTAIVSNVTLNCWLRWTLIQGSGVTTVRLSLSTLLYKGIGRSLVKNWNAPITAFPSEGNFGPYFSGADLTPGSQGVLLGSEVNDESFGAAINCSFGYTSGTTPRNVVECNLITAIVFYAEAESEALCYQKRSIELRSDGCYRQDLKEETWGEVVPQGNFPYAPAAGLEKKPARGIIIPSQGDLTTPDVGVNQLQVMAIERPAYQFTSEAVG